MTRNKAWRKAAPTQLQKAPAVSDNDAAQWRAKCLEWDAKLRRLLAQDQKRMDRAAARAAATTRKEQGR